MLTPMSKSYDEAAFKELLAGYYSDGMDDAEDNFDGTIPSMSSLRARWTAGWSSGISSAEKHLEPRLFAEWAKGATTAATAIWEYENWPKMARSRRFGLR